MFYKLFLFQLLDEITFFHSNYILGTIKENIFLPNDVNQYIHIDIIYIHRIDIK